MKSFYKLAITSNYGISSIAISQSIKNSFKSADDYVIKF